MMESRAIFGSLGVLWTLNSLLQWYGIVNLLNPNSSLPVVLQENRNQNGYEKYENFNKTSARK